MNYIRLLVYRLKKVVAISASAIHWIFLYWRVISSRLINPYRKHIGILLAEHFGDIVACEPIASELKRLYPQSKIYWIVKKAYRDLVAYNPAIDVVVEEYSVLQSILLTWKHPFDQFHNCQMPGLRYYPYLGKMLDNPRARSMNITLDTYYFQENLLTAFTKIGGLHAINKTPKLFIPDAAVRAVEQLRLPPKFVVVHCHSNWSNRDWQTEGWLQLIDDLVTTFKVCVVEIGLKSTLPLTNDDRFVNLCGKLSLLETAEVIRRASYFIGIDSGPAHLGNAVGTFGFILLGKLNQFNRYMPYSGDYQSGRKARFIVKDEAPSTELTYEEVWPIVRETILVQESDSMEEQPERV